MFKDVVRVTMRPAQVSIEHVQFVPEEVTVTLKLLTIALSVNQDRPQLRKETSTVPIAKMVKKIAL